MSRSRFVSAPVRASAFLSLLSAKPILSAGATDEAVPNLLLAIQDDPGFPPAYRNLAACYAHMGRLDEARDVVRRLRAITPAVISPNVLLRNPEHRDLLLSGLRLAVGEAE